MPAGSFREHTEVKILTNCLDESVACMAAVGKELGADKVLFGKMEKKDKSNYVLAIKLLNVSTKTFERGTKSVGLTAADSQNEAAVKEKVSQVFAEITGTELTGSLSVKANVETGTVSVGGEPKGQLVGGVATITDLPEGSLLVSIDSKGYKIAEQQVPIVAGKTAQTEFTLEVDTSGDVVTPPPGGGDDAGKAGRGWRIAGYSAAAVGVIAIGVGAWQGLKIDDYETQAMDELMRMGGSGTPCASGMPNTDGCKKGDRASLIATVGLIGGPILTVAAAGLLYKGFTAERRPSGESSVRRGPRFVVAPHVLPDSAGATLFWQF
jgi:hypothetical protein